MKTKDKPEHSMCVIDNEEVIYIPQEHLQAFFRELRHNYKISYKMLELISGIHIEIISGWEDGTIALSQAEFDCLVDAFHSLIIVQGLKN